MGAPQEYCLSFLPYVKMFLFSKKGTRYHIRRRYSYLLLFGEIDVVVNAELDCLKKLLQGNKLSMDIVKTSHDNWLEKMNNSSESPLAFQE